MSSGAGRFPHPYLWAYGVSKAGICFLAETAAEELGPLGIRVNAVAPGEIETAMLSPETETLIPLIPQRRLGKPDEVAATIFYLCSPDSSYVTGTEIFITGGQHLF